LGWSEASTARFVIALAGAAALLATAMLPLAAQETAGATRPDSPEDKRWQAVAPGRIEPVSGEIRIAAPMAGLITQVLVKTGDKVSINEPLIRLFDQETRARVDSANAQIAVRKRARNDQAPSSRAADRRKAEDAVAEDEQTIVSARAEFDRVALERRAGRASDLDLEAARSALSRAQERLQQHKADLRKLEANTTVPLPTQVEGELNIARADLWAAEAALEKLIIRAPIAGTILQVNAKAGEIAAPGTSQPLVLLGDLSALRVRAELDERDYGEIKLGQAVSVRPEAFRGREFAGTVASISPLVEPSHDNARSQRNQTDVDIVEVMIDLPEPGPLAVGMRADVYFRYGTQR
jgi:HlyD family secretion protein